MIDFVGFALVVGAMFIISYILMNDSDLWDDNYYHRF